MNVIDRELRYPWSDGSARMEDPTYGRIDRDIQWAVHDMSPGSLSQRVADEINLQERRDRGETILGMSPRSAALTVATPARPIRRFAARFREGNLGWTAVRVISVASLVFVMALGVLVSVVIVVLSSLGLVG